MQNDKELFVDMDKNEAIRVLQDCFVDAREKISFPTNSKIFDEDVNVYIAHLLCSYAMPNYTYVSEQYISVDSEAVHMMVSMAEDDYSRYFIYKVNADNLLLHIALFKDLPAISGVRFKSVTEYESFFSDLAKEYYREAAKYNRKVNKRKTALGDVLLKVVKYFKLYGRAVHAVRKDYYFFYNYFDDGDFQEFATELYACEKEMLFQKKQDRFLGLYAKWLKTRSKRLRSMIDKLCDELHALDETFLFKIQ